MSTKYIDPNREYREAAEQLAALVLEQQRSIRMMVLPNAAAEMVRLAEILKAQPGNAWSVTETPKTYSGHIGPGGLFADHGDGTHIKFEPVAPDA